MKLTKDTIDSLKFILGIIVFGIIDYIIVFKFFKLTPIISLILGIILAIVGVIIYFLIQEFDEIKKWLWKKGIIE